MLVDILILDKLILMSHLRYRCFRRLPIHQTLLAFGLN